jgi:enamine deaminase RidA (YjgF/YER057c/UK114 family)
MKRKIIATEAKWEDIVGYSRAVWVGNTVEVSGTVAIYSSGEIVGENDVYLQTKFILMRIENVLGQLNVKLSDVVRTRIFVKDISKWELVGKAHGEVFGEIKPATNMVGVSRLIDDKFLVEIEATAILSGS